VQEATPVYAVQPAGPFAGEAYKRIARILREQISEGVSRVSIAGYQVGSTKLMNGQEVSVVVPDIRGMYSWSTPALIEAVLGKPEDAEDPDAYKAEAKEIGNFLDRVYYELSNLGLSPQERAINYAATNAYQVASVFKDAIKEKFKLDRIDVERSSVCRPGSDCWDVILTFFDPVQRHERAKELYRFTIDVSEVLPVTVGSVRHWSAY
jgi:cyanobactin maturation PatA/PatG family protease